MAIDNIPDLLEAYKKRFLPEKADGVDGIIQLSLHGDGGGDYYLIVKDQTLNVLDGLHENPTVTLKSSAKDWINISTGQSNPMMLMMTGKLKVSGSLPMATKFQTMFR